MTEIDPFASPRDIGDPFDAAFAGTLSTGCGCYVEEGDPIGYVDGELSCTDCYRTAVRHRR